MPDQLRSALTMKHTTPTALFMLTVLLVLSITAAPATAQHALEPGQSVDGHIDTAQARDSYTFDAEAGDTVALAVGLNDPSQSDLQPRLAVFDPNGTELDSASGRAGTGLRLRIRRSGTHAVVVHDRHSRHTGRYRLVLLRAPDPSATDDRSSYLVSGEPQEAELPHGGIHMYRYEAQAGDRLHVAMAETEEDSPLNPSLTIVDPHGRPLGASHGFRGTVQSWRAVHSGTYYILAGDRNRDESGPYRLTLAAVPGDGKPATDSNHTALRYNQRTSGTLEPGDIDIFQYQGVPGVEVHVATEASDGNASSGMKRVQLYDPHGWLLDEATDFDFTNVVEAEMLHAKPHHIVVYHGDAEVGGDYEISVSAPVPPGAVTELPAPETNDQSSSPGETDQDADSSTDDAASEQDNEQAPDGELEQPIITSVEPDPVTGQNSPQPFTIRGRHFHPDATVTLRDLRTDETFRNRPISDRSDTHIVINPNFTNEAARWSVQVENPGGRSSEPTVFEVAVERPPNAPDPEDEPGAGEEAEAPAPGDEHSDGEADGAKDEALDEDGVIALICPEGRLGNFRHGTEVHGFYNNQGLVDISVRGQTTDAEHTYTKDLVHAGLDIAAPSGSAVYPAADGVVRNVIDERGEAHFRTLGYAVLVEHDERIRGKDTYSLYLHLNEKPDVSAGQRVARGETRLGGVGATGSAFGSHLHFEIRHFAEWFSPRWANIYGKQSPPREVTFDQADFRESWSDPLVVLRRRGGGD